MALAPERKLDYYLCLPLLPGLVVFEVLRLVLFRNRNEAPGFVNFRKRVSPENSVAASTQTPFPSPLHLPELNKSKAFDYCSR